MPSHFIMHLPSLALFVQFCGEPIKGNLFILSHTIIDNVRVTLPCNRYIQYSSNIFYISQGWPVQLVNRVFRIFRLATPKFLYQKYGRTQFELFCCILCIQNIVIYCQTQGYLLIEMSTWDVHNSEILIRTHCTQKILTVGFKCTKIYIYRTGYKNHSFDDLFVQIV